MAQYFHVPKDRSLPTPKLSTDEGGQPLILRLLLQAKAAVPKLLYSGQSKPTSSRLQNMQKCRSIADAHIINKQDNQDRRPCNLGTTVSKRKPARKKIHLP